MEIRFSFSLISMYGLGCVNQPITAVYYIIHIIGTKSHTCKKATSDPKITSGHFLLP